MKSIDNILLQLIFINYSRSKQQQMIRQIQQDATKSQTEKQKEIKKILQTKSDVKVISKAKCVHYDKRCYNFLFQCCQTYDECHRCHAGTQCRLTHPLFSDYYTININMNVITYHIISYIYRI